MEGKESVPIWYFQIPMTVLYEEWLKKEDSSFDELKAHIDAELGLISDTEVSHSRKDTTDGKRIYQAA